MDFKKMFVDNKKETSILVLALIVICIVSSSIFYNKGNRNFNEGVKQLEASYMNNHKEEYETLLREKENTEKEVDRLEASVSELFDEAEELRKEKYSLQDEIEANIEKIEKIEDYESIIDDLETEKDDLEQEISSLNINKIALEKEKNDIQDDIDKLKGELVEASGSPIELQAGMWFQETDEIPAGRYTVSNGDSNFFVYDEDGDIYVNVILDDSNSGWGVSEYTFVLLKGSIIETNSPCTLTPVE